MSFPVLQGVSILPGNENVNKKNESSWGRELLEKIGEIIAKISNAISDYIEKRKASNLNSPEVREMVAKYVGKEFIRHKMENPETTLGDWFLVAKAVVDSNLDLRNKSEKNKDLVVARMLELLEYSTFNKKMKAEIELEAKEKEAPRVSQTTNEGRMVKGNLLRDVHQIKHAIVRSWLQEKEKNSGASYNDFMNAWRMTLASSNIENNTEENIEYVINAAKDLLLTYHRNIDVQELQKVVVQDMEKLESLMVGQDPVIRKALEAEYEKAEQRWTDLAHLRCEFEMDMEMVPV